MLSSNEFSAMLRMVVLQNGHVIVAEGQVILLPGRKGEAIFYGKRMWVNLISMAIDPLICLYGELIRKSVTSWILVWKKNSHKMESFWSFEFQIPTFFGVRLIYCHSQQHCGCLQIYLP